MKENELIYWIWLSEIKGIGPVLARSLLKKFNSPECVYNVEEDELLSINGIGTAVAKTIIGSKSLKDAEKILMNCNNKNIGIITKNSGNYPSEAKKIWEMPILFYYRGKIIKDLRGVGVVGTRRCSGYGKRITVEAVEFLSKNNIPVISGMAKGVDSYAHTACLNSGGYTIAVLGCGVDICYPREHLKLMEIILENGALISQYPPGTKPNAMNFPKRNKIISGISQKLLVVEAGEKSGSLFTVKYANKYEKPVYVVPGNIYSSQSKGTNKLLLKGTKIYLKPDMLLEGLEISKESEYEEKNTIQNTKENKKANKLLHYDKIEKLIIEAICKEPKSVEELIILFKDYDIDVIEKISIMELEGKVSVFGGMVGGA